MPNWCSTRIRVYDHEKRLEDFGNMLELWTSTNAMENGFDTKWLGNIVLNSGIGTVDTGKSTDLRCRGTLCGWELSEGCMDIETETAWSPMLKMWKKLFEEYIPEADWVYEADECGMAMYYTNDPAIVGKYVVDIWDDEVCDYETDWEMEEEDVVKMLKDLLHTNISNIRMLLKRFDESELSDHMGIHEWEWADVDEWD